MALELHEFKRVGVLMGGPSTERPISLKSARAVIDSLQAAGVDVVPIDITTDNIEQNKKLLQEKQINCAFIALHGRFGEDGQIQRILDELQIPYTGSSAQASSIAMDKVLARQRFAAYGLRIPGGIVVTAGTLEACIGHITFGLPWVIKPATQGSSIGLSIIRSKSQLTMALDTAFEYDREVVIEEYIKGRELTVGILDDKPLPVIEIVPKNNFFDYEAKYQSGLTDYIIPAKLTENIANEVANAALAAHKSLGCYGVSRVDIILSEDNLPYILELNNIPGLTATSLLPKAAKTVGIDFTQLCMRLLQLAYEKKYTSSHQAQVV